METYLGIVLMSAYVESIIIIEVDYMYRFRAKTFETMFFTRVKDPHRKCSHARVCSTKIIVSVNV